VNYAVRPALVADYGRWSEANIGNANAIVLDGVVWSAPVFMNKIPGLGQIGGDLTNEEAADLAAVLRSGSLPPAKLIAAEPLPASEFGRSK
jgi:preprotein translocase subunit SecD